MAEKKGVNIRRDLGAIIGRASTDFGLPKKQIEETMGIVADTVNNMISDDVKEFKEAGDKASYATPFGRFVVRKMEPEIITNDKGEKIQNPVDVGFAFAPSKQMVQAGNPNIQLGGVSKPIGEKAG